MASAVAMAKVALAARPASAYSGLLHRLLRLPRTPSARALRLNRRPARPARQYPRRRAVETIRDQIGGGGRSVDRSNHSGRPPLSSRLRPRPGPIGRRCHQRACHGPGQQAVHRVTKENPVLMDRPARAHAASEVLAHHRSKYLGENEPEDRHGANRCYRQPISCKGRHRPKTKGGAKHGQNNREAERGQPAGKNRRPADGRRRPAGKGFAHGADIDPSPMCTTSEYQEKENDARNRNTQKPA